MGQRGQRLLLTQLPALCWSSLFICLSDWGRLLVKLTERLRFDFHEGGKASEALSHFSVTVIFGSVGMLRFAVSRHLLPLCQAVSFQGHLACSLLGFWLRVLLKGLKPCNQQWSKSQISHPALRILIYSMSRVVFNVRWRSTLPEIDGWKTTFLSGRLPLVCGSVATSFVPSH